MAGKIANCKKRFVNADVVAFAAASTVYNRLDVLISNVESTEAILLRKRKFSDTSLIVSWCTESDWAAFKRSPKARDVRKVRLPENWICFLRLKFRSCEAANPICIRSRKSS